VKVWKVGQPQVKVILKSLHAQLQLVTRQRSVDTHGHNSRKSQKGFVLKSLRHKSTKSLNQMMTT